jgi:hypothetical protein
MEIGTEILLKRIQDCPEEFVQSGYETHGVGKWFRILNLAKDCLPKEEFKAIEEALDAVQKKEALDRFNTAVFRVLTGEDLAANLIYKSSERYTMADPRDIYSQQKNAPRGFSKAVGIW